MCIIIAGRFGRKQSIGMSPSGKAPDFDSGIRRFKSGHPSQKGLARKGEPFLAGQVGREETAQVVRKAQRKKVKRKRFAFTGENAARRRDLHARALYGITAKPCWHHAKRACIPRRRLDYMQRFALILFRASRSFKANIISLPPRAARSLVFHPAGLFACRGIEKSTFLCYTYPCTLCPAQIREYL